MPKVAVDLEADIQPVSDFRANASAMLQQVRDTGRPIVLTQRGRGAAVLLDIRVYQQLLADLEDLEDLRDVALGLTDVSAGRVVAHDEVAERARARLKR